MIELTPDEHKILVDAIQDSATVVHKGRKDMNERIDKLFEQAIEEFKQEHEYATIIVPNPLKEKFAELIVKECAKVCRDQPNVYALKADRDNCAIAIEQHFGVEE
jgi:guanylate kinase